jgi:hypothetical protein
MRAKEVWKRLRHKNFQEIMRLEGIDLASYRVQLDVLHPVSGYCNHCERNDTTPIKNQPDEYLSTITHGAHTLDFLEVVGQPLDQNWSSAGVLFLFENPGPWWEGFGRFQEGAKHPIRRWYWVHELGGRDELPRYPDGFAQRKYGLLIASLIRTFGLANAYVTNVVKCGTAKPGRGFASLRSYAPGCVRDCIHHHLRDEIRALDPAVVFTFGKVGHGFVREAFPDLAEAQRVVRLSHPAHRGMTNDVRKAHYLWTCARALYEARVLDRQAVGRVLDRYLGG